MNYIFDLDDTLIDNSDIVYEALGQLSFDLLKRKKYRGLEKQGSLLKRLKDYYAHQHFLKTKEYTDQGIIKPAPGVKEFLEEHKSFIAAHTNAPHRSTKYKLEKLGLEDFFEAVETPRTVERKPNPGGIHKLIEQSGKSREDFVYVGDSLKDLMTGKRAKVRTILISGDRKKKFFASEHYDTFTEFARNH